jgi:uncharacterized protein YjbI with pentapeptide repeats
MDRDEAIRLLQGGPDGIREWNQWRRRKEKIPVLRRAALRRVDLRGAKLDSADLCGADLRRAGLTWADLRGADLGDANLRRAVLLIARLGGADLRGADLGGALLCGADLRRAVLIRADLRGAALGRADLRGAALIGADLRGADLGEADLRGAALIGADLGRADLRGALCGGTAFGDVDLSQVKGLEAIRHHGPSTVGVDTLFRPRGRILAAFLRGWLFRPRDRIPAAFLRGCGVPEALITYLPSLIGGMKPIQFYSCFLSYSTKDQDFAERLHADLQDKDVRCWYAPEDLKIGARIRVGIDESIRAHDRLLLVLSRDSVASEWVEKEVETAMEQERRLKRTVLFPIRLDDAVLEVDSGWPADIRRSRNIGDFRRWKAHDAYREAFDRLLRDLRASEE